MPRRDDITDKLPDHTKQSIASIEAAAKELGYTDLLIKQEDGQYRVKGFYRLNGVLRWRDSVVRRYGSLEAYKKQQADDRAKAWREKK